LINCLRIHDIVLSSIHLSVICCQRDDDCRNRLAEGWVGRLLAREYVNADWQAKIADLDIAQGTSFSWQARRLRHDIKPALAVERFGTVEQALRVADHYDLLLLDGPAHSTAGTLRIAQASELVILPSGLALDDLEPSVLLAQELVDKGVAANRVAVTFCRVGDSDGELAEARSYIEHAGFRTISGCNARTRCIPPGVRPGQERHRDVIRFPE
jgi:hypothetical protein